MQASASSDSVRWRKAYLWTTWVLFWTISLCCVYLLSILFKKAKHSCAFVQTSERWWLILIPNECRTSKEYRPLCKRVRCSFAHHSGQIRYLGLSNSDACKSNMHASTLVHFTPPPSPARVVSSIGALVPRGFLGSHFQASEPRSWKFSDHKRTLVLNTTLMEQSASFKVDETCSISMQKFLGRQTPNDSALRCTLAHGAVGGRGFCSGLVHWANKLHLPE